MKGVTKIGKYILARFCELKTLLGKLEGELEALREQIVQMHEEEDAEYELGKYKLKIVHRDDGQPNEGQENRDPPEKRVELRVESYLFL